MSEIPVPEAQEVDESAPPDDETLRRAIPAEPEAAPLPEAKAIPEKGSTDDLENQGLQSKLMARPIPTAPEAPETGSTEDLENRSLQTFEHPHSAPIQTGVASLWTKAQNIHNPVLRVLGEIGAGGARALDVLGTTFAPRLAAAIPGTTMNKQVGEDRELAQEEGQAGVDKTSAEAREADARTNAIENPPTKEEAEGKTITTDEGIMQWNPATKRYDVPVGGAPGKSEVEGKTVTTDKGVMQWNPETKRYDIPAGGAPTKPGNDFEQYYKDYLTDNNFPDTAHNRLLARREFAAAGQAPEKPLRQLVVLPGGKVAEVGAGETIPEGSQTVAGDLKTPQPTADEKKRADLVENLNENLDQLEDIVNRRPDLFGKVAGRYTQLREWTGSSDPDVAALKGISDRLGMVQQSSHGMRSAQHVEQSANSVLNGFKNGPDAMKKAIADARKSGETFTKDVQNPGRAAAAPTAQPQGELKPPKEADPGMKWQHRTVAGKTEWRQVKAQ